MNYAVQAGDTLAVIAVKFNTTVKKLMEVNGITNPNTIYPGQVLVIPETGGYNIEVDTKQRVLKLLKRGTVVKQYPVAVGKASTPTPLGSWTITKKALWGEQFGGHFMQLSVPWGTYGIHGTNKPWSIGQPVSNGCIRMYNQDAEELYGTVAVGTPVLIY